MPVQKAALKMQDEEAEGRHSARQCDLEAAGQNVGRAEEGLNEADRMEWSVGPACGCAERGCAERGCAWIYVFYHDCGRDFFVQLFDLPFLYKGLSIVHR